MTENGPGEPGDSSSGVQPGTNDSGSWSPLKAIRRFFIRLVDSGIPEHMRSGDVDTLRRARIVVSFAIVLIMLGLETGAFFVWILVPEASTRILMSLVAGLVMILMVPAVFRRTGSLAAGTNLVIAAAFVVTVTIFTVIGGIESPLIHWCALFPLLAAFMGARKSAWFWTIASAVTVLAFIAADALGIQFFDAVGFRSLEGPPLWFQRFLNMASWLGILLAVALLFVDHSAAQHRRLVAQNAELQSQMAYRNRAEQRSQFLAYYDELTGLPNRRLFLEQLSTALDHSIRADTGVGLLFIDLDRFKEVNDMYGHARGDQLLQQVAERLQQCLRGSDRVGRHAGIGEGNVARLGGDEFTVLLNGIHDHRDAARVAQRIIDRLCESFDLGDLELFIGTSIGIAVDEEGVMQAGDLLRNADLAMYRAKNSGKNGYAFHQESMNAEIIARTTITDALRRALEAEQLELYFQPIVESANCSIIGVEGLVRWHHADAGAVSTETLIAVAEESGLIIPLGEWVINEGCRSYERWRNAGIRLDRLALNISAEQFRRGNVVETIEEALWRTRMAPGNLEIEITEGAMMADEHKALQAMEELRRIGVSIALDDFGTGYSSLSYVHRFPVDRLKIDRSFVSNVQRDQGARAIATAVLALGQQLEMKVVGEGVETVSQEQFLKEHGCDELQGYLYSKPIPASEVQHLLAQQRKRSDVQG